MYYNVLQYLEEAAAAYPDKIALEDEAMSVSYQEYQRKAQQIGSFILRHTNGAKNRPVAVLIERNVLSVLAFLGVAYSGNFYVPVDVTMPEERVGLMFKALDPVMLIDARGKGEPKERAFLAEEILSGSEVEEEALLHVRQEAIDTDPLYAIFTSGSTGIPKGVAVSHRSVMDLAGAFEEAFSFDEGLVFGNQAPFDFDVSVKDIYNAIKCKGTVQVLPKKLFKIPKLLIGYLHEKQVNTLIWAVSALRIVADFKTFESVEPLALRYVMFSGEVMPVRALNYWMDHVTGARYVNLYGPTEITCNCTYYEVTHRYKEDEMLPVGKPFVNTRVMLRDANGQFIQKPDEVGEICVSGTCLALGYWNNPQKTEEAFVQDPGITAYRSRMYATGDMGYYNADGNLVFASRKDYQIKHMGHRIELGEIEVALNAIPFLTISCCLYDKKNEKIVCFYQAKEPCKKEIVAELSKKLPKYMWPNVYEHYEALPMNKNGKIDRVALGEKLK